MTNYSEYIVKWAEIDGWNFKPTQYSTRMPTWKNHLKLSPEMAALKTRWKRWRRTLPGRIRRIVFPALEPVLRSPLRTWMRRRGARYVEWVRQGRPLPSLAETEFKVYSQNGEDGILLYLLSLAGANLDGGRFLEIGIQDGWECNCANLAKNLGWEGWFVEGNPTDAERARAAYRNHPATKGLDIRVIGHYVTRENVNALLDAQGIPPLDLFSIDIDGMDWWVWKEMRGLGAKVVVVEYNSAFGPEREVTVEYHPTFDRLAAHPSKLYYGASLAAFVKLGREKGYRFAGVDTGGVNAFFIREDLAPPGFPEVFVREAFRENWAQRGQGSPGEQFDLIRHLHLVEV